MTKISLRAYDREIEALIEHDQRTDEAIAHCRHILKTFPKHLETYRLLGKGYLEAKRYHEAVDIFERVLVSAPDDFVSHVGMSIIADDQGSLDDAIWHMERAFEMQPANAAIQGELQRLFARRDGVEPPKIRLTRGALARMYMQGELYTQAISEIKAVISSDPKRADMQVLLAKACYLSGQKIEATTISTELLSRYPYSLDANRLMAEILPGTQRADAAQEYRQRVIELDPYAAFAGESLFHTEGVADSAVSLERLEYSASMTEPVPVLGLGPGSELRTAGRTAIEPEWLTSGAAPMPPTQASEPTGQPTSELPDFLRQAGWSERSPGSAVEPGGPAAPTPAEPEAVPANLPDWVQAFAPLEADQTPEEPQPVQPAVDAPDWLADLGSVPSSETQAVPAPQAPDFLGARATAPLKELQATPESEAPDWLRGLGSVTEKPTPEPAASEPTDWMAGLRSAPSLDETPSATAEPEVTDEVPDWLRDLGGREVDEPAALSKPVAEDVSTPAMQRVELPEEESPSWLKDFASDLESPVQKTPPLPDLQAPQPAQAIPAASIGSLGTTAQEQDDAMAWLENLAAKHGAKPEELVTDPDARKEAAPEWVDKARQIGEVEPATPQPPKPEPAPEPVPTDLDLTGKWLRSLQSGEFDEKGPEVPASAAEDSPTIRWIDALSKDAGFTASESENEERPIMEAGEAPAWLGEAGEKPAPTSAADEVPSWLDREAKVEAPAEPATAPDQPAAPVDLPEWLAGLDEEETRTQTESDSNEDVPVWLRPESESTPQATEPTRPADWKPAETVGPEVPAPTTTAVVPEAAEPEPQPASREPKPSAPRPAPVARPRPAPVSVRPTGPSSLDGAQAELGRGNIAAALDVYERLIRKGKSLEEIIRDLRDALYRYPVEIPIWQALGDAYMRANRLQEALDAYTKAEELLR